MSTAPIDSERVSQRIVSHARRLCVDIGARLGGTPGNHAAGAYVNPTMAHLGFSVEMQEFGCHDWRDNGALVELGGALARLRQYVFDAVRCRCPGYGCLHTC